MTIKIGINGFGRIGRLVARALVEYSIDDVELVAINSPGAIETSAHLLRYDSVHGRFQNEVKIGDSFIDYGVGQIAMSHHRDPGAVDWGGMGVDIVMECTGIFRSKDSGIRRGFMTTVHSYTQDQRILDNSHKDLYRARAAGLNMIPTSTPKM